LRRQRGRRAAATSQPHALFTHDLLGAAKIIPYRHRPFERACACAPLLGVSACAFSLCELCGGAPTILLFTICCLRYARRQALAETVIAKNDLEFWKTKNKNSTILRTVSVAAALNYFRTPFLAS